MWGRGGRRRACVTALITSGCGGWGIFVNNHVLHPLLQLSSIALSLWLAVRPSLDDKFDGDDPNKPKNSEKNYFVGILKSIDEKAGSRFGSGFESRSGSVSPWYRSADPDPYQNVTDPQHCFRPKGNVFCASCPRI